MQENTIKDWKYFVFSPNDFLINSSKSLLPSKRAAVPVFKTKLLFLKRKTSFENGKIFWKEKNVASHAHRDMRHFAKALRSCPRQRAMSMLLWKATLLSLCQVITNLLTGKHNLQFQFCSGAISLFCSDGFFFQNLFLVCPNCWAALFLSTKFKTYRWNPVLSPRNTGICWRSMSPFQEPLVWGFLSEKQQGSGLERRTKYWGTETLESTVLRHLPFSRYYLLKGTLILCPSTCTCQFCRRNFFDRRQLLPFRDSF